MRDPTIAPEEMPFKVKPLRANLSMSCFRLAGELPQLMKHWPKMTRMGIGRKLEEHIYSLLDASVEVSNPNVSYVDKLATLQMMSHRTDSILVYLRLGLQTRDIDTKRYRELSDLTVEIGQQVGGLGKFLKKSSASV